MQHKDTRTHQNLPSLLLRTREKLMERFRPLINEYGLTDQQWRIIHTLADQGPMEPRQLSETCTISSPSLAGVLARMEAADLVTKERFVDDQRRVLVSMTPQSEKIVRELKPRSERIYQDLEKRLGAHVLKQVYRAIDALEKGLDE